MLYKTVPRLNVTTLDDDECMLRFRFTVPEVRRIIASMHLPDGIRADNGCVLDTVTAMCLLLRRLAFPNRYCDMSSEFGIEQTIICRFILTLLSIIDDRYR